MNINVVRKLLAEGYDISEAQLPVIQRAIEITKEQMVIMGWQRPKKVRRSGVKHGVQAVQ